MKKIIKINTESKRYEILVQKNVILNYLRSEIKKNIKNYIFIDSKISYILQNLKDNKKLHIIKIKGGESIKSINNYSKLMSKLLQLKIDRSSQIIAIGGGTIGDLSGFIASTVLRGVKFTLIPTTLLSQVDSSIGGKNGINSVFGKNLIGTFLQPDKVIIDISILNTLSQREIRSGYAEILKHAIIKDIKFYKWLHNNYNKIFKLDDKVVTEAIIRSIKIKSFFIQKDEKEKLINSNSRAMLNFGHTFGHALEAMNGYNNKLNHGEAISIGMAVATKLSCKINSINIEFYKNLINHLKKVGLPYSHKYTNYKKFYRLMLSDKKNSENNINLILLKKIGEVYFERGLNFTKIKKLLN